MCMDWDCDCSVIEIIANDRIKHALTAEVDRKFVLLRMPVFYSYADDCLFYAQKIICGELLSIATSNHNSGSQFLLGYCN